MIHEFAASADLAVSFQRYPYPANGFVSAQARSRGVLPVFLEADRRRVSVPSPLGEAFWIGLVHTGRRSCLVSVSVLTRSGERLDALGPEAGTEPAEILVPPAHSVAGMVRDPGNWWAFARETPAVRAPECQSLDLSIRTGPAMETSEPADGRRQHTPDQGRPADPSRSTGPGDRVDAGDGVNPGNRVDPSAGAPPTEPGDPGGTTSWHVELLGPDEYRLLSGQRLPPLNAGAGYRGARLP